MVVVYSSVAGHLSRVLAALPVHERVMVPGAWHLFQAAMRDAPAGVVVLPWLREETGPRGCALGDLPAGAPLVLVTLRNADNARCLDGVRVAEVVWLHEVERELWPAVQRVMNRRALHGSPGSH